MYLYSTGPTYMALNDNSPENKKKYKCSTVRSMLRNA